MFPNPGLFDWVAETKKFRSSGHSDFLPFLDFNQGRQSLTLPVAKVSEINVFIINNSSANVPLNDFQRSHNRSWLKRVHLLLELLQIFHRNNGGEDDRKGLLLPG